MEELISRILRNNSIDDLTWFCSLSESQLDFVISLKKLAIQRAKISGYEQLAERFDLKMLRALGLVLMDYARTRVQNDTSLVPTHHQLLRVLDDCSLLKTCVDDDAVDIEKILTETCSNISSKRKSGKRRR